MIFHQILHRDPIGISYLFGCGGKAVGAVCDPIDDPAFYMRLSQDAGLPLRYVIDTHLHADHISGARRLAEKTGAEYVLHASADTQMDVRRVNEGDVLDLGNVSMRVLHTPGHTPEHLSLLVTDRTRGPEPWFLLSGHTVMVGDVGRTELASHPEVGARSLFHTVERLKHLPDYVEIFPGAYAGSVCGRALSGKPVSTIGFERRFNRAFQIEDVDALVRYMLENIPPPPPGAAAIRAANQGLVTTPAV
jgi:glyoxylase-like metal-dependent hydrolase (beta-lactamase superfamily II)